MKISAGDDSSSDDDDASDSDAMEAEKEAVAAKPAAEAGRAKRDREPVKYDCLLYTSPSPRD